MGQLRRRAVSAPSDLSHLDRRPLHPNTHGDVGAGHGVPARRSITLPQSPLSSSTGLGPRACLGQRSTRARAAGGEPVGVAALRTGRAREGMAGGGCSPQTLPQRALGARRHTCSSLSHGYMPGCVLTSGVASVA